MEKIAVISDMEEGDTKEVINRFVVPLAGNKYFITLLKLIEREKTEVPASYRKKLESLTHSRVNAG